MNLIKLSHTSLEIFFSQYNEKTICQILLRRLLDVLPACTCASSMSNLCSNCFGGNILTHFSWVHLHVTGFIEEVDNLNLNYLDDVSS